MACCIPVPHPQESSQGPSMCGAQGSPQGLPPPQDSPKVGIPATQDSSAGLRPRLSQEITRGNRRVDRVWKWRELGASPPPTTQEPYDLELVPYTPSLSFLICMLGLSACVQGVWPLNLACSWCLIGLIAWECLTWHTALNKCPFLPTGCLLQAPHTVDRSLNSTEP